MNLKISKILLLVAICVLFGCGDDGASSPPSGSTESTRLVSIEVEPSNGSLAINEMHKFLAVGLFENGESVDLENVKWSSSDERIASVERTGEVITNSTGMVTIKAACEQDESIEGTATLHVVTKRRGFHLKEIEWDSCFTFVTNAAEPGGCESGGDMYFQDMKDYADIGPGYDTVEDHFCKQEGTFSDLESIPDNFFECNKWQAGIDGHSAENTGYIVWDSFLNNYYKMRIVSNNGGTTRFEYKIIDYLME